MATFFDKFRKYTKDYVRERTTWTKDVYGQMVPVSTSSVTVRAIITTKRSFSSEMSDGKSQVGTWVSEKVAYIAPEMDVLSGDILIDIDTRYQVKHKEWQDDFKNKRSHFVAYLQIIS